MEKPLGDYSMLATGGTFGDVLFFFCSGYTLFLGKETVFFNWYKRRINRIYPTVFAWALVCALLFGKGDNMLQIILSGGGWFVSCILIYYVLLWFIRRYMFNALGVTIICTLVATVIWYIVFGPGASGSMYGETYFKWCHYFFFMLLGAIRGLRYKRGEYKANGNILFPAFIWIFCTAAFYVLFSFYRKEGWMNAIQLFSLVPLAGVCLYGYNACNSRIMQKAYNSKYLGFIIKFVGGLCLEIYLVQTALMTDKLNNIFPLNILVIFIGIVISAYLLRCLSRIWSQTFKDGDYDWKAVVKAF